MGELQGYALLVVGIVFTVFVIPAIFRRNHVTVSIPADERYSANLRMLAGPSEYNARTSSKNRGTLLPVQPEVVMMSSKPAAPRVDAPSGNSALAGQPAGPGAGAAPGAAAPDALRDLARARARKSALLAARQARLSRVLAGAGGLGVLALLLWVLVAVTSLPIALPILATLVAVAGFGVFGYLLTEARKASNADMADIRRMSAQLAEMGSVARASKPAPGLTRADQSAPAEQLAVPVQVVTEQPVAPAVAVAESVPAAETREPARAVAAPIQRVAAPAPTYTVKPKIERRTVRPYVAPTFPTATVPYRPKELGEMFAPEELSTESASEIPTAESAPDFTFNLDDALARRRA